MVGKQDLEKKYAFFVEFFSDKLGEVNDEQVLQRLQNLTQNELNELKTVLHKQINKHIVIMRKDEKITGVYVTFYREKLVMPERERIEKELMIINIETLPLNVVQNVYPKVYKSIRKYKKRFNRDISEKRLILVITLQDPKTQEIFHDWMVYNLNHKGARLYKILKRYKKLEIGMTVKCRIDKYTVENRESSFAKILVEEE